MKRFFKSFVIFKFLPHTPGVMKHAFLCGVVVCSDIHCMRLYVFVYVFIVVCESSVLYVHNYVHVSCKQVCSVYLRVHVYMPVYVCMSRARPCMCMRM